MNQFFLIAVEIPDGWELEDVIQGAMENVSDMEPSDVNPISEDQVPASAYRIEWSDPAMETLSEDDQREVEAMRKRPSEPKDDVGDAAFDPGRLA